MILNIIKKNMTIIRFDFCEKKIKKS